MFFSFLFLLSKNCNKNIQSQGLKNFKLKFRTILTIKSLNYYYTAILLADLPLYFILALQQQKKFRISQMTTMLLETIKEMIPAII